jgi:hypothetical protein
MYSMNGKKVTAAPTATTTVKRLLKADKNISNISDDVSFFFISGSLFSMIIKRDFSSICL